MQSGKAAPNEMTDSDANKNENMQMIPCIFHLLHFPTPTIKHIIPCTVHSLFLAFSPNPYQPSADIAVPIDAQILTINFYILPRQHLYDAHTVQRLPRSSLDPFPIPL